VCTASWLGVRGGYELFFSRDEARARRTAQAPRALEAGGVRVLAPVDGEAGGTWIAVSELGLTVALLNGESDWQPARPVSRGLLVLELAGARESDEIAARLAGSDLASFRAFRLLALEPGTDGPQARVRVWGWDGSALADEPVLPPLASSSLGSETARGHRARALARLTGDGAADARALESFHKSHEPERGPWSPCVHRTEVVTHSLCHVRVGADEVAMRYAAGSPCESRFGEWLVLARRSARAADGRTGRA
jgi:hypothetical protein